MSDDLKKLKIDNIKDFFSSLSKKERCAIAARGIMVLSCIVVMLFMTEEFSIKEEELFVSIVTLSGMGVFFGPVLFLTFYWGLFLPLMADIHLFRAYGLSLSSFGDQIIAIIYDTNRTEIFEYLIKIGWLEWSLLFVFFLFSVNVFFYRPDLKGISKKTKILIFFCLFCWYPFSYVTHLYPFIGQKISNEKKETLAQALAFQFQPVKQSKADTVVVLIGESHRHAEFFPAFDKYVPDFQTLYRFSDMISPFAGTLNAVPVILSRKKITDTQEFFYEKSLFSLFKEAGYSTYFVHYVEMYAENQLSFVYREADNFIKYAKKITPSADEGILTALDDILADKEQKKLIVIKMMGVHVNFVFRYPDPELSTFQRMLIEFKTKTKEREMYHYNKAISYSASVVAKIMEKVEKRPEPSLLFFSSDHGICIFDKGHFHLPPTCQNAFHVPAMVLLNPALDAVTQENVKRNLMCNQDKPLTGEFIFETVSSLSGIVYPTANEKYDLTKQCNPLNGKKRLVSTGNKNVFYEDL